MVTALVQDIRSSWSPGATAPDGSTLEEFSDDGMGDSSLRRSPLFFIKPATWCKAARVISRRKVHISHPEEVGVIACMLVKLDECENLGSSPPPGRQLCDRCLAKWPEHAESRS